VTIRRLASGDWQRRLSSGICLAIALTALLHVAATPMPVKRLDGFNIVAVTGHPFGSASANFAMLQAKRVGAEALAIIPFLWQSSPESAGIARGNDMPDDELRSAIRETRRLGMAAIVKPQVWVPKSWAGAVEPATEQGWTEWFAAYGEVIMHLAALAAEENAEAFVIGTELSKTSRRPEWAGLIGKVRALYPGLLFYVAHNADEAELAAFWPLLDAIGISLYPPLGMDNDREARLKEMRLSADRIDALSQRLGKPVFVAEIGLRSAQGAASKPWESAEERVAAADPLLQAEVLADWLSVLDRPAVHGVLIWRWLSDPSAGGLADTDFTVQGKPAEEVLLCAWTVGCQTKK
jgi:glycosyl hydrolase family 113